MDGSAGFDNLMIARRLLVYQERFEKKRTDPSFESPSLKEDYEEEQGFIEKSNGSGDKIEISKPDATDQQEIINLGELTKKLDDIRKDSGEGQKPSQATTITFVQKEEIELSVEYMSLVPVDGLAVRSKSMAESDRYRFSFSNNGTDLTITDKGSMKSTRIWGDPHIDTNDEEGDFNGEFKDLTNSNTHTTFLLRDGTRVTFKAIDTGLIEEVDIIKENVHIKGFGAASAENEKGFGTNLLDDGVSVNSVIPLGDIVRENGDGNDWYDTTGHLVWGKTTGPIINSRPNFVVNYSFTQKLEQNVAVQSVNRLG